MASPIWLLAVKLATMSFSIVLPACGEFGNKIKIIELPNIMDIFYGRGVGYNIEMIELSQELQQVSATKIRAGEIGQDGKTLGKRPE